MNKGDYLYAGPPSEGEDFYLPTKPKLTWNKKFMDVAKLVASWSKDKSVGVGAVITKDNRIISTGYNGFPERIDDEKPERHERPDKYEWTAHAEENAIINVARMGGSTDGATLYCTWFPCASCARKCINAGIKRIVCGQEPDIDNEKFGAGFAIVLEMLHEADVDIEYELEKRVFKIDVGDIPDEEIEKYIQEVALRFKKHNPISATLEDADGKINVVCDNGGCGDDCTCRD